MTALVAKSDLFCDCAFFFTIIYTFIYKLVFKLEINGFKMYTLHYVKLLSLNGS